jgi:hypothetical protein
MTSLQEEPAGIEQGVAAGIQRAGQFNLTASPQPQLLSDLNQLAIQHPEVNAESWQLFAEIATTANVARQQFNESTLRPSDLQLAFSFWEWLFDGLVRR